MSVFFFTTFYVQDKLTSVKNKEKKKQQQPLMLVNPPLFSFSFHTTNKTHSVGGKPHLFKNFYHALDVAVQKLSFHRIHLIWGKCICWSRQ